MNLSSMSDEELILLRASLRVELRKRGIADSVGAVGEQLAIEHFRKTPGLPKLSPPLATPRASMQTQIVASVTPSRLDRVTSKAKKTGTIYPAGKTATSNCSSIFS